MSNQGSPKDFKIKLVFDGKRLCFVTTDTNKCVKCWKARSGKLDANGNTQTGKDHQKKEDEGPTPEGKYKVGVESLEKSYYPSGPNAGKPKTASDKKSWMDAPQAWGPIRTLITPETGTETYGRGGMYIHGGKEFGTIGCIDLNCASKSFFEYWEGNYDEKGVRDNPIQLVVDYTGSSTPEGCPEPETACTKDDYGSMALPGSETEHAYAKFFAPQPGDVISVGDDLELVAVGWGDGDVVDLLVEYRMADWPMFSKLLVAYGRHANGELRTSIPTRKLYAGRLELKLTAISRSGYRDCDYVWGTLEGRPASVADSALLHPTRRRINRRK